MRKMALLALTILFAACSQIGEEIVPDPADFSVNVTGIANTNVASHEIEMSAELINISESSYMIEHASPLVQFQVFDWNNEPVIRQMGYRRYRDPA